MTKKKEWVGGRTRILTRKWNIVKAGAVAEAVAIELT